MQLNFLSACILFGTLSDALNAISFKLPDAFNFWLLLWKCVECVSTDMFIVCAFYDVKCLKTTMFYIWLDCDRVLSQLFPATFTPTEIHSMWTPVNDVMSTVQMHQHDSSNYIYLFIQMYVFTKHKFWSKFRQPTRAALLQSCDTRHVTYLTPHNHLQHTDIKPRKCPITPFVCPTAASVLLRVASAPPPPQHPPVGSEGGYKYLLITPSISM